MAKRLILLLVAATAAPPAERTLRLAGLQLRVPQTMMLAAYPPNGFYRRHLDSYPDIAFYFAPLVISCIVSLWSIRFATVQVQKRLDDTNSKLMNRACGSRDSKMGVTCCPLAGRCHVCALAYAHAHYPILCYLGPSGPSPTRGK